MIYINDIVPYNEFWLDCDSEVLFSILVSMKEEYKALTYLNNYSYLMLGARTPNGKKFYEIRMLSECEEVREKTFEYTNMYKGQNIKKQIADIKTRLQNKELILVGIDLFEWIEKNMCYKKHHVEHYCLVNGYDDVKNEFYIMETDNERYKQCCISESRLFRAMCSMSTLKYNYISFTIKNDININEFYTRKKLINNSKRIVKTLKKLQKKSYWIFDKKDYKAFFYRDMSVMYLMQINCRAKANKMFLEYLESQGRVSDLSPKADEIEQGWIDVRRNFTKCYLKEDALQRCIMMNDKIQELLKLELTLWKEFVKKLDR